MDETETAAVGVRVHTAGFARDVAAMRGMLEGSLGQGAQSAGRSIETALLRAARQGEFGFDQLRSAALQALADIARAAVSNGVRSVVGGEGRTLGSALIGLLGLAGRATGGPVAPGQAYVVGERGPEVFVPTHAGRVEVPGGGAAREVRVAITINAGAGEAPAAMQRSARQVARAVKAAIEA